MGAAAGDGDLFTFKHAVPVARVYDGLASPAAADLAIGRQPVGQLLVYAGLDLRQFRQQSVTIDPLLAQAFADTVLLLGSHGLDPRGLDGEAVKVGLIECIALAHLFAPVGGQHPIEGQRRQMAAAVTQT